MKKLLLIGSLFIVFLACNKEDKTAHITSYGQAIDSMHIRYDKAYILFFDRQTYSGTVRDSDRIIFRTNGTVSEVSHKFDSGSYTYPDTFNFAVNTSFDYNIDFNNIPNTLLFNFYPSPDTIKGYLLHDYLINGVVSIFRGVGSAGNSNMKFTPTITDSTAVVTGFLKLE